MNKYNLTGLIDTHIHGGYGVDFNTASMDEVLYFAEKITHHGVAGFFPTVMTDSVENIKKQLDIINKAQEKQHQSSAKILGVHLEGPFLASAKKGIHSDKFILDSSIEAFKEIEHPIIKIVTLAPENNVELISYLNSKNIHISAGHTRATASELVRAQQAGLGRVTHLFNAMNGLHHRDETMALEALLNDNITVELIADGVHISKKMLRLVFKIKNKEQINLVSDSLPLNRAEQNSMIFGGQEIFKADNKAINKHGTLAGSLMFLDDMIEFLVENNLCSLEDAIFMASEVPKESLDITRH